MKIEIPGFVRAAWHAVTEVPGWPDAPLVVRLRRFLPILVPCAGIALLLLWRLVVHEHEVKVMQEAFSPVVQLERQVEGLRLAYSEQEAAELAQKAASATESLAQNADEVTPLLSRLREGCKSLGWDGAFQAFDLDTDDTPGNGRLRYIPVLGRINPVADGRTSFQNLIRITELVFNTSTQMDLTRLAVQADAVGHLSVEMGLRVGVVDSHEKAAE